MNRNLLPRTLAALVASPLLLGTVVLVASAQGTPLQCVDSIVVAASSSELPLPDNPATGRSWGPLFQLAG